MSPALRCLSLATALLSAVASAQTTTLLNTNPFTPAPEKPKEAPEKPSDFALQGVLGEGNERLIGISRLSDKRFWWLKQGEPVDGIEVLSYNENADQAVVRAQGRVLTLTLKQSKIAAGAPIPGVPVSPPNPGNIAGTNVALRAPLTNKEKEVEARMLVSDLLEIGMQQRKAYQEAKRKEREDAAKAGKTGTGVSSTE